MDTASEVIDISSLSDEQKEIRASKLYGEGFTFAEISDVLDCSKSYAQELCRRGISKLIEEEKVDNIHEVSNNPIIQNNPVLAEQNTFIPQRIPETYILETQGIPRRVTLTPKCLMIYDLWVGNGFQGDLSDFLEDAVEFLYNSSRPRERMMNLR